MPEGTEEISWPWIKEALPKMPLTQVFWHLFSTLGSLLFLRSWLMRLQCFCPLRPCASFLLWTSSKTTFHRCPNINKVTFTNSYNLPCLSVCSFLATIIWGWLWSMRINFIWRFFSGHFLSIKDKAIQHRSTEGCRKPWRRSRLWWRIEEANTITSTQKMLLAASITKSFHV